MEENRIFRKSGFHPKFTEAKNSVGLHTGLQLPLDSKYMKKSTTLTPLVMIKLHNRSKLYS